MTQLPRLPRARQALGLLAAVAVLSACSSASSGNHATLGSDPEPATAGSASQASSPSRAGSRPPRPAITKVLVFMVENHTLGEMQTSMPYVYKLAKKYAYADHYQAITHPSLPNYLAIASGGTQGVTDDSDPSLHPLSGKTVFDQALDKGKTAKLYADAMTQPCEQTNDGTYAVRHNPWAYFTDSRAACNTNDVPVGQLATDSKAGKLPNAGMVIPDVNHDAHDAPLGTADAWIKGEIQMLRSGPDWKSGHLAIVVTADEDDRSGDNTVLTVVASRYQVKTVVHRHLNHYSLTALYDAVIGAQPLGEAATAASMLHPFRIRVR